MMKRLFQQVKGSRKLLLISVIFGCIGGLVLIAEAHYVANIVNKVFLQGATLTGVKSLLIALLAIIVLRGLLHMVSDYTAARLAQGIKSELRMQLIDKINQLGPQYSKGERSGELVSTLYEGVEQLENYLAKYMPQIALSMFVPFAVFVVVLGQDGLSALIYAITLPLLVLFMILIGKFTKARTDRQYKLLGRLGGHFQEILRGIETLKVFNRSKDQLRIIGSISEQHRRATMATLKLAFLSAFVMELFATLSTAVIAVFLGLRLIEGQLQFYHAFLILLLTPEFYAPIRALGTQFHAGMNGASAATRIFQILDTEPQGCTELADAVAVQPNAQGGYTIEFEEVTLQHDGYAEPALNKVSFKLEAGQTLAIVGATGAGKSSILELLQGFIKPTSGNIYINGIDLQKLSIEQWRQQLTTVSQSVHLFHGTIRENIALGLEDATDEHIWNALRSAAAEHFVAQLPQGLDTVLNDEIILSGGQKQRLVLARAMLRQQSPIVLLDEATNGLDVYNEQRVMHSIEGWLVGKSAIIVTHHLHTIAAVDQMLVLDHGQIVEAGTPQQLVALDGQFSAMLAAMHASGAIDEQALDSTIKGAYMQAEERAEAKLTLHAKQQRVAQPATDAQPHEVVAVQAVIEEQPHEVVAAQAATDAQPHEVVAVQAATDAQPHEVEAAQAAIDQPHDRAIMSVPQHAHEQPFNLHMLWQASRRLTRFLAQNKVLVALAVMLSFLTIAANIGLMGTSGYLIAKAALRPENVLLIYVPIVGVRFFGLSRGVFRYLERLAAHNVTFKVLHRMRLWLYERIEPSGSALLKRKRGGNLLGSLISDIEQLQHYYLRLFAPPIVFVLTLILVVSFISLQHYTLGLALFAMLVVAGIFLPYGSYRASRQSGVKLVQARTSMYEETLDLLRGLATLQQYGIVQQQRQVLEAVQQQLNEQQRREHRRESINNGLMTLMTQLGMWVLLLLAIPLVGDGTIAPYMLPAILLMALASFEAAAPLPQAFAMSSSIVTAANRVFQLADAQHEAIEQSEAKAAAQTSALSDQEQGERKQEEESEHKQTLEQAQAASERQEAWRCELKQVSFCYAGSEQLALNHISLSLTAGKQIAVVGESGAGKSTLLQALLKLQPLQSGSITINGSSYSELSEEQVRSHFAVVSQQVQLFNATVAENLRLGNREASIEQLRAAARLAEIDEFIMTLPQGYDTMIGEYGAKLSGGQRQRLALARALLKPSAAILFDEPATGLDHLTQKAFRSNIVQELDKRAMLWITHRLADTARMDEVIVLRQGKVVERGTHEQLLAAGGYYAQLWRLEQAKAWHAAS